MVEVRTTRLAVETLADEGEVMATTRQDIQIAADFDAAVEVRVTRQAIECLAPEPLIPAVTRQDIQVAAGFDDPVEIRCSRIAIEVLAGPDAQSSVTRQDIQVAASFDNPTEVQVTRQTIECLARQGSAGPVTPLALMDDAHVFLHNWATKARIRTSFRNNVAPSPASGAESRRGLGVKPYRTMDLEWLVGPGTTLDDLERLEVFLRRMTDQRFQVPIYKDQQELNAAYLSTDDTLVFPTNKARFFSGARVAVVQLDNNHQVVSSTFHIISGMTNAQITLAAPLGVSVASGSLVFPIMDCEVQLEVKANFSTARVPYVKLTVAEAPGASQLPPLKSDTPSGASLAHDDRPIWFEEPDWSKGIVKGRSRQGRRTSEGRADIVSTEADRSRQTHEFQITGARDDMWNALEFFETRRGRLRSFWHIDQDQYMVPVDIDVTGTFIGVSEIGDIADFTEEFDAVGIIMEDGTYFVREVTNIQDILGVFRITMGTVIDSGLSVSDVVRVARARLVRFKTDEFVETWTHTGYMSSKISIIEVLNEQDFTI